MAVSAAVALAWPVSRASAIEYPIKADGIYGQTSYTQHAIVPIERRIYRASGIAYSPEGLYISDAQYNRVMLFPHDGSTPTRVYGQPDFKQTTANNGGISASSLNSPQNVAVDSSGLYVADYGNNRVLHYPPGSTTADRVFGQPDFVSNRANAGGLSASSLRSPYHIAIEPGGGLYILDIGNNRVLYYPPGETTATFVYGQPTFTSSSAVTAPDRLNQPNGVAVDASGIYVSEWVSNRVVYFPKGSKTATRLYGQPDYYSRMPNAFGMGPRGIMRPMGIAVDEHGLYVSEFLNSRVLFFPNGSTTASVVYGQPDFNTLGLNQYGISPYGFYVTNRVAVSEDNVFIADYTTRVLRFPKVLTPMAADAIFSSAPSSSVAGEGFAAPVIVVVRRSDGSPAVDFNGPVKVRLEQKVDATACGRLVGTTTVNAVAGVATFSGLAIDAPGTYRLEALAKSLPVATSDVITVASVSGQPIPGDVNRDGTFNMADIVFHLRVTAGLEVMP